MPEFGLFSPLRKQICVEAQNVVVVVRRINYLLMSSMLAIGEISVGISYTTELRPTPKRIKLRDLSVKVLRGDDRPGPLTLDEFCGRPHALIVVFQGLERRYRQSPGAHRPAPAWRSGVTTVPRPARLAGGH